MVSTAEGRNQMTTRFSKIVVVSAFVVGAVSLAIPSAQAGEWFQPPGSTETGSVTFPDGTTNYEFQMPDGTFRLVSVDKNGGMHRYFNPRAKHVLVNKNPPEGGNPYIPTKGHPLEDRSSGSATSTSVGGGG